MKTILFALLMGLSLGAVADNEQWKYDTSDNTPIAWVLNSVEEFMSFGCSTKNNKCIFLVSVPNSCDEGVKIPVLMQVGSVAKSIVGTCRLNDAQHSIAFAVEDIGDTEGLFKVKVLAFAVSIKNGYFKAFRFSTRGMADGISKVIDAFKAKGGTFGASTGKRQDTF